MYDVIACNLHFVVSVVLQFIAIEVQEVFPLLQTTCLVTTVDLLRPVGCPVLMINL